MIQKIGNRKYILCLFVFSVLIIQPVLSLIHQLLHYSLGKDQCLQSEGALEIVHQPFCTLCTEKIEVFTMNCTIKF